MAEIKLPKRVTREDLEQYFALEEQRLSLKRQADDIVKLQRALEAKFERHVRENGGVEKSVVTCGYRLYFVLKSKAVAWKEHFLDLCRLAGREPLKEAEKLTAAAPKKEELVVEPPPAPEDGSA